MVVLNYCLLSESWVTKRLFTLAHFLNSSTEFWWCYKRAVFSLRFIYSPIFHISTDMELSLWVLKIALNNCVLPELESWPNLSHEYRDMEIYQLLSSDDSTEVLSSPRGWVVAQSWDLELWYWLFMMVLNSCLLPEIELYPKLFIWAVILNPASEFLNSAIQVWYWSWSAVFSLRLSHEHVSWTQRPDLEHRSDLVFGSWLVQQDHHIIRPQCWTQLLRVLRVRVIRTRLCCNHLAV